MSLLTERFLARAGDGRLAIVDARGEHTYASLVKRARSVATSLGERRGERVAVYGESSADFIIGFYAILLSGGCVVVLSPNHPLAEQRYYCADAEIRTVLGLESLADTYEVALVAHLHETPAKDLPAPSEDAPALQLYTSGTTGKPKGAILTHANIGIQQQLVGEAWGFRADDRLLHSLPLHHMHGLAIALLTALGAGATIRFRPFQAAQIWDAMADATVFMGVPSMYHRLFLAFDEADEATRARWTANAKQLRLATSGSAALPVTLAERWRALNGRIPLERFGMTEVGVGITNPLAGERHAGCVGLPLATQDVRIVGEDGKDADTGELWMRGPSVFVGYHKKEAETAAAFVPAADGGAAWFRTGDTVTRVPELAGQPFKILGRTSVDILKSGGYKLSALEIEEVLRRHDAVEDCAVVGIPDEAWGERVVACVTPRTGRESIDAETLRAFVREHLAPYKVPKQVLFFPELPRNALGKVVKPDLAKIVAARSQ